MTAIEESPTMHEYVEILRPSIYIIARYGKLKL